MTIANQKIEVGDVVRVRYPPHARDAFGKAFTVAGVKSYDVNETPYWTLINVPDGNVIVIDFEIVLEVLTP